MTKQREHILMLQIVKRTSIILSTMIRIPTNHAIKGDVELEFIHKKCTGVHKDTWLRAIKSIIY